MYSITVKGKVNPKDKKMVRLEFVFFKTNYNRVSKVINVVGPLKDWDQKLQAFKEKKPELIAKNKLLLEEKLRYLSVVEQWDTEGINWSPIQWSHCFDKEIEKKKFSESKIISVSAFLDQLIEMFENTTREKNGRTVSSKNNAKNYAILKTSLMNFTQKKYQRSLTGIFFTDITEQFILDYTDYIKLTGKAKGNRAGLPHKLRTFRATCSYAKKANMIEKDSVMLFHCVKNDLKHPKSEPKTVPYEVIKKIEDADKSKYKKLTQFYIDLFLFSFYTGGMANVDVCHLTNDCIKNGMIIYERTKTSKEAKAFLLTKAQVIIDKYKNKCIDNYVLPVFSRLHNTEQKRHERVVRVTGKVNKALAVVCKDLQIEDKVTWYSARGSFITKLIDEGFSPLQVAEQAGNSPQMIYKHYYKNTKQGEIKKRMEYIF